MPKQEIHSACPQPTKLYRSETDKVIAGVAGGLGDYFNIDTNIIRFIFVALGLLWGIGILVYLILWVIIPPVSKLNEPEPQAIGDNVRSIVNKFKKWIGTLQNPIQNNPQKPPKTKATEKIEGKEEVKIEVVAPTPPPPSPGPNSLKLILSFVLIIIGLGAIIATGFGFINLFDIGPFLLFILVISALIILIS